MANKREKIVVGIDEVGRGPLAGSVIAVAITIRQFSIFNFQFSINFQSPKKLKDSKQLTAKKREEIFEFLKNCPEIKWGIGKVSEKIIDKINILEAAKLAMEKAVNNLKSKIQMSIIAKQLQGAKRLVSNQAQNPKSKKLSLLIDGNFGINLDIPQKSIIKGDEKIFEIKLASIVAKVTRDRMMLRYHKKYPEYGFDKHKGYGTKMHFAMLKKYGPCEIHRRSFNPVKTSIEKDIRKR